MHSIARTQKILTSYPRRVKCRQQKHTPQSPSTKTECDYLNGWIMKKVTYAKSSPKMVNPSDVAGNAEEEEEEEEEARCKLYIRDGFADTIWHAVHDTGLNSHWCSTPSPPAGLPQGDKGWPTCQYLIAPSPCGQSADGFSPTVFQDCRPTFSIFLCI